MVNSEMIKTKILRKRAILVEFPVRTPSSCFGFSSRKPVHFYLDVMSTTPNNTPYFFIFSQENSFVFVALKRFLWPLIMWHKILLLNQGSYSSYVPRINKELKGVGKAWEPVSIIFVASHMPFCALC